MDPATYQWKHTFYSEKKHLLIPRDHTKYRSTVDEFLPCNHALFPTYKLQLELWYDR